MGKIKLEPSLLLAQAGEMERLGAEYEDLFRQVTAAMERANTNWSPNLAHNFSGKIASAQRGFSGVVDMLGYGAGAARMSAQQFVSIDSQIARYIQKGRDAGEGGSSGGGGGHSFGQAGGIGAAAAFLGAQGAGKKAKPSSASAADFAQAAAQWWAGTGKKLKTGAKKLREGAEKAVSGFLNEYEKKGLLWKSVQTVKAVAGIAGGLASALVGLGATGATAGVSAPVAVLMVGYGVNSMSNGFCDLYNIWFGDKEQVGETNILKSCMKAGTKTAFGEETGEVVGEALYAAGQVVTAAATVSTLYKDIRSAPSMGKTIKNLSHSNPGVRGKAAKTLGKGLGLLGKTAKITEKVSKTVVGTVYKQVNGEKFHMPIEQMIYDKSERAGEFYEDMRDIIGLKGSFDKIDSAYEASAEEDSKAGAQS